MTRVTLESLWRAFDGVVPTALSTCDRSGVPNISMVSSLHYVDKTHVAVSRQFFNKTTKNLLENPQALAVMWDPITASHHRLRLRYDHSETSGPLFETMALRIQVIASHVGMQGIFRLAAADVFEVLSATSDIGVQEPAPPNEALDLLPVPEGIPTQNRGELWALQRLLARMSRTCDLDELLGSVLETLAEDLEFRHSLVLVPDESGRRLVTIGSHGYGEAGIGAEVPFGEGLLGIVADRREAVRLGPLESALRYGRAARKSTLAHGGSDLLREIPLPGLANAQSQMALPLLADGELVGVLAFEAAEPHAFEAWHEVFLNLVADRFAHRIRECLDADAERGDSDPPGPASPVRAAATKAPTRPAPAAETPALAVAASGRHYTLFFYKNDDCIFIDDSYLIRGVPARILWRVLTVRQREGRSDFTNRELRLDPWLGLPPIRDNLESRLVLLKRRLAERCPEIQLVSRGRGRFGLQLSCGITQEERASAALDAE